MAALGYHLVVRQPRPDFRLILSTEPERAARGGAMVTVVATRLDGFDGRRSQGGRLPPGLTATWLIERGVQR